MDLSLNADAPLRAYLPPESWNGDAQYRFIFRTEDGDEETLLARLAVVGPNDADGGFEHCVILRPENAEPERIFIVENFRYDVGRKGVRAWMTSRTARRFNWPLFERYFNEDKYNLGLSRLLFIRVEEREVVLLIAAQGWGNVLSYDGGTGQNLDTQGFRWHSKPYSSHTDLQFLRQDSTRFQHEIRDCFYSVEGEIRIAVKFQFLGKAERDLIAFNCRNGKWSDLLYLAGLALRVYLSRLTPIPTYSYKWNFVAHPIEIQDLQIRGTRGFKVRDNDFLNYLFCWRAALTQSFQTDYVNANAHTWTGSPLCIETHIIESEMGKICVRPFDSQHELLDAQLQLREWANSHFPPEEAQQLLSL